MPHLRRYLPPLLLLLPLIFICGKLMFSMGMDDHHDLKAGTPSDLPGRLYNVYTETRGWPWAFRRTFFGFDGETNSHVEITRYLWGNFLGDALVWTLPILIAAWLLARHRRRTGAWLRFSLRTLLIFIAVVGVGLGIILKEYRQWAREQAVVDKYGLSANGYDGCPEWLRRLWFDPEGPEWFDHPTKLDLFSSTVYGEATSRAEKIEIAREALTQLPAIRVFEGDGFIPLALHESVSFSKIKFLDLMIFGDADAEQAPEILELVSGWTQLNSVIVRYYKVSNEDLRLLGKLINLEHLQVDFDSQVGDAGIAHLANLKQLSSLTIEDTKITDRSFDAISGMSSLRTLILRNQPQVTSAGLSKLTSLTNLEHFELIGTGASPGVTEFLAGNKQLKRVEFSNANIDDTDFKHLSKFSQLRLLRFPGTHIKGIGFDQMASLNTLEHLDFSRTEIGDEALQAIGQCKSLNQLFLIDCKKITDEGIAHLARLPRLTLLDLGNTQITDRSIESLLTIPWLEWLHLSGCTALTDDGVKKLARAPRLRSLSVHGIPMLSDDTINLLKQKIADVTR